MPIRRIRFKPTDRYLGNPHKGCCTFQRFNGDPLNAGEEWDEHGPLVFPPAQKPVADDYLPSKVAYCRWFWEAVEPEKGRYDFSMIERALEVSAARGQTLAIRIMPHGASTQAFAPAWYARSFPMEVLAFNEYPPGPVPVYDGPAYFEHFGNMIRACGARFDGHPGLESVDVAFLGPWGEGAGVCRVEQVRRFVDLYKEAFPTTLRLALMEGPQLRMGVESGSGWRCDCFGDLKQRQGAMLPPPLTWNHTYDCYPRQIIKSRVQHAWMKAPVHFETCWVPGMWYREGFDLNFILAQGLKFHGTYFMPKSSPIPGPWLEPMAKFCRQLGYRFALRQVAIDQYVAQRAAFHFEAWIENVGVAPLYHNYALALRLRQGDQEVVTPLSCVNLHEWLPGDAWVEEDVTLSDAFRAGSLDLAVGLVHSKTNAPGVRFAVEEQDTDGWVPLGGMEIR